MKIGRIGFYLWMLVVLLPLSIHAELRGHLVYRHPYNYDELWITDIRDTRNARLLFKHTKNVIQDLSVQKNSRYIFIISTDEKNPFIEDVYRVDTLRGEAILIKDKFGDIAHVDTSPGGDVVLTGRPRSGDILMRGIYLMPKSEIGRQPPKFNLLKEIGSFPRVDWAPNGKQIVHSSTKGVFILDVDTKNETRISRQGKNAVFSPDGKKLAFSYSNNLTGIRQIDIISLDTLQPLRTIKDLIVHSSFSGLRWTQDGEYLIYTVFVSGLFLFDLPTPRHNIAIPVNGGPHERILDAYQRGLDVFDWINPAYPVEPVNHLTTLWGKIKQ